MQSLKTLSLTAIAACATLVTSDAQANPWLAFGSAVNRTVSYATAPVTGYNCANGVCRPVSYGVSGPQIAPTGYCSGPNCASGQTVGYGYVTPTYAPSGTWYCPGGSCGQYGYGYGYGYPIGVGYYGSPVINSVSPAAPVYAVPSPSQPVVGSPAVLDRNESSSAKPAAPVLNTGVNTSSPFYP